MNIPSIKKGLGFGITSAIITTLGIIVGMHGGTNLREVVIGAVLIIAFSDSLADSLGIYFSEKAAGKNPNQAITAMISAFLGKILFALTFLIPILLFNLHLAIIIDIIYGMILLGVYSYYTAKDKNESTIKTIIFHIVLAIFVISAAHLLGLWINSRFK